MSTVTTAPGAPPEQDDNTFEPPHYRRPFGIGRDQAIQYGILVLLAEFVLAPVVPTLYQSFIDRPLYEEGGVFTTQGYADLFTDAGFGQVILNTLMFAGLTTL